MACFAKKPAQGQSAQMNCHRRTAIRGLGLARERDMDACSKEEGLGVGRGGEDACIELRKRLSPRAALKK